MAKLNIDIGVNLGTAIRDLGTLKIAFDGVSASLEKFTTNVNTLKTSLGQLKSTSVNVNVKQSTIQSGGITQPKLTPVPDIFVDYRSGASKAGTVADFLKQKQAELEKYIRRLQKVAGNTTDLKIYEEAQRRIGIAAKQLSQINVSSSITNTGKSATYANMALTDMGRIIQDLPYGFLGISNNINPLVESFRALSASAKENKTSVGKELLGSLKGFGGVGIAISAASAALSLASVGLSYWTRKSKEAKVANDDLKKAEEELKRQIDLTNESISKRTEYTEYLRDFSLTAAQAAGKTKQELRNLEDVLYKGEGDLRTAADAFGNIQIVPGGLIAQAAKDREDAARQYVIAFTKIMGQMGASYDQIRNFELNYYNDSVSGYNDYSKNMTAAQRQQINILRKDYSDKQAAFESINRKYNLIVANRALEDKKEADKLSKNNAEKKKTLADYFAEVGRDIKNINANPLTPFDIKQQQIASRIEEAIKYIVDNEDFKIDLDADLKLSQSRFRELQSQLSEARIKLFGAQQEDEFNQLIQKLKTNAETADILGTDRIEASINDVTGAIARAIEEKRKFSDEPVDATNILEYADALLESSDRIDILSQKLKELGEQKAFEERVKELRDFGISIDLLSKKMSDLDKNPFLSEGSTDKLRKQAQTQREIVSAYRKQLAEEFAKSKGAITPFILYLQKKLSEGEISLSEFEQKLREVKLAEAIKTAFEDTLVGIAEGIGEILGGEDAGDVFGKIFGQLTTSLGKALIQFAKEAAFAKAAFDKLKETLFGAGGWGAIAAVAAIGIGLVATGKILSKKGFASGGYVSGDGGPTSDSIPARLSNGEYVVRARSVSQYGKGFLDMINQGTFKRFANGGLVTNLGIPGLQSMGYKSMINNLAVSSSNIIAETRISGQDLRLILSRSDNRFNSTTSNPATSKSFVI